MMCINDPAFQKVDWTNLIKTETGNGRSCRDCIKANVCKYQERVIEEVEKLVTDVEKLELPLSININCIEYSGKSTVNIR